MKKTASSEEANFAPLAGNQSARLRLSRGDVRIDDLPDGCSDRETFWGGVSKKIEKAVAAEFAAKQEKKTKPKTKSRPWPAPRV